MAECATGTTRPISGTSTAWPCSTRALVLAPLPLEEEEHLETGYEAIEEKLIAFALERYDTKLANLGENLSGQLLKFVLIQTLDDNWRDHLNELIMLRSGIGLRSYGQRDPLVEYKAESFELFEQLLMSVQRDSVSLFFRAELAPPPEPEGRPVAKVQTQHQEVSAYDAGADSAGRRGQGPARRRRTRTPRGPSSGRSPRWAATTPAPAAAARSTRSAAGPSDFAP